MYASRVLRLLPKLVAFASLGLIAACAHTPGRRMSDHDCMTRVMYFESNRSSEDGMLAVGTVVMNRVRSDKFPNSICAVVGQKNQFAPGVLSKPMKEGSSKERASKVAKKVMRGARHPQVGPKVMFFHTVGYSFPYTNMHYQVIAGGNIFYEKRTAKAGQRNTTQTEVALRQNKPRSRPDSMPDTMIAAREPAPIVVASRQPPPAPAWTPPPQAWTPPPAPAWTPPPAYPAAPQPASIEDLISLGGR